MRAKPDNTKEGFKGYAIEDQLHKYEDGDSHLILHDTLGCPSLRAMHTITVWADNIIEDADKGVFLHARCV